MQATLFSVQALHVPAFLPWELWDGGVQAFRPSDPFIILKAAKAVWVGVEGCQDFQPGSSGILPRPLAL